MAAPNLLDPYSLQVPNIFANMPAHQSFMAQMGAAQNWSPQRQPEAPFSARAENGRQPTPQSPLAAYAGMPSQPSPPPQGGASREASGPTTQAPSTMGHSPNLPAPQAQTVGLRSSRMRLPATVLWTGC